MVPTSRRSVSRRGSSRNRPGYPAVGHRLPRAVAQARRRPVARVPANRSSPSDSSACTFAGDGSCSSGTSDQRHGRRARTTPGPRRSRPTPGSRSLESRGYAGFGTASHLGGQRPARRAPVPGADPQVVASTARAEMLRPETNQPLRAEPFPCQPHAQRPEELEVGPARAGSRTAREVIPRRRFVARRARTRPPRRAGSARSRPVRSAPPSCAATAAR